MGARGPLGYGGPKVRKNRASLLPCSFEKTKKHLYRFFFPIRFVQGAVGDQGVTGPIGNQGEQVFFYKYGVLKGLLTHLKASLRCSIFSGTKWSSWSPGSCWFTGNQRK